VFVQKRGEFKNQKWKENPEMGADEIGRLIQAVALYCAISPTGSKPRGANPQNS